MRLAIPSESIGSIPRPRKLIAALSSAGNPPRDIDCGFAPFCDDTSASRETAFAKIRARIEGTLLAAAELNG